MFLLKRKKGLGQKVALVFDIGSSSVGGALVLLRGTTRRTKVLYTTRRSMVFSKELNFDRFTLAMLSTLEAVAKDIETKGMKHLTFTKGGDKTINNILCSYASPWYISQVKVLSIEKEKPFVVTKEIIDEAVRKAEKEMMRSQKESDLEKAPGDIHSFERQVIDVRLSEYQVQEPYGKKTKQVSATVAMTMISQSVKDKIENLLTRSFYTEKIFHHSFSLIGFTVIRDLEDSPKDFLFIDVGGEVTDVSLVKDDVLLDTTSFPLGRHFIIREIAHSMGISLDEAVSYLRMYLEKTAKEESALSLETHLSNIKDKWMQSFGGVLEEVSSGVIVPHKVYLSADRDVAALFGDFIKSDKAHEDMLTARPFEVIDFRGTQLSPFLKYRGGAAVDPFLALETVYFNKILPLV